MLYFDTKVWLVEFAASIPSKYKISKGEGKYLLKRMMADILPHEIVHRKKMGFPTPLKRMFAGELYAYAADLLLCPSALIRDFFIAGRVEQVLKDHKNSTIDHYRLIWQIVVLWPWLQNNSVPLAGGNDGRAI